MEVLKTVEAIAGLFILSFLLFLLYGAVRPDLAGDLGATTDTLVVAIFFAIGVIPVIGLLAVYFSLQD